MAILYSNHLNIIRIIFLSLLVYQCDKFQSDINLEAEAMNIANSTSVSNTVNYIDMEGKSLYDLFMIESLQGNVNRVAPEIWVLKTPIVEYDGPGNMVDRSFWFNEINGSKVEYLDPYEMLKDFSQKIDGCIIYDDNLFGSYVSGDRYPQPSDDIVAKLNVTAMHCAKYNAVALTESQRLNLKNNYGIDLPILASTSTIDFVSWESSYNYMLNNFSADFSTAMMANNSHYCLGMFDFLIKNKMFIFNMKNTPSLSGSEQTLTDNVFNRCSGVIPVYGIWNLTGGNPNEDEYQVYINNQGKYSIPNFEVFNLSYTSGLPAYIPLASENNRNLTYDPTKKYISFTETDGDNYEFIQQVFPLRFQAIGRENYPIGWEIPSTICELDPIAAKWYYENRGDNCFVNPVTGAGYNKYPLPQQYWNDYFNLTDTYMDYNHYRTIRTMGYDLGEGRPLTDIPSVEGVFCGYGHDGSGRPTVGNYHETNEIYNGKVIFENYSYTDINDVISFNQSNTGFFSIACVYIHPNDIISTINSLSLDWVVVSPNELVDLYKQYIALTGGQGFLASGQYITKNQYITSKNSKSFLIMQDDGNLVQYKGSSPSDNYGHLWDSGTGGSVGNYFAIQQNDGNLVIYKGTGPSDNQGFVWSSGQTGPMGNYFLNTQDDYNLVIYRGSGPEDNQGYFWSK